MWIGIYLIKKKLGRSKRTSRNLNKQKKTFFAHIQTHDN